MSASKSFVLTERGDLVALKKCIETGYIVNDLPQYKRLLRQASKNGGEVSIVYQRHCFNGNYYGRFWPKANVICGASMWSAVRSDMFSGNTIDIDMVNCVPSIMADILTNHDISCTLIHEYVKDRSSFFPDIGITEDLVEQYNKKTKSDCTVKDMCKRVIISHMFGGTTRTLKKEFGFTVKPKGNAKQLIDQIKTYSQVIINYPEFKQLVSDVKVQKEKDCHKVHQGSLLSAVLFHLESEYVLKAMEAFKAAGFEIAVYVYDGFQVYSTDKGAVQEVLDRLNEDLPATINFIDKPFKTKCTELEFEVAERVPMELTTERANLTTVETLFKQCEKTEDFHSFFEYMNHYFCTIDGGAKRIVAEIVHGTHTRYCPRLVGAMKDFFVTKDQRSALTKWLGASDKIHRYERMLWIPWTLTEPKVPHGVLNTFSGFVHPVLPNHKVDMSQVQPWLDHLYLVWASKNEAVFNYIVNLFASMMQHPDKKTGVATVLKSDAEGAGKNTVLDFMCTHVLGRDHVRQITQLERLFQKFNADAEKSVMTICDEIGARGASFKNAGTLKSLITQTQQTIEIKGLDKSVKPDYNNYFFTSNEDWIIKVSSNDRRFLCLDVSECKVGDTEYFDNLYSYMTDVSGFEVFHYLLSVDLTDFNPRNIPMTEWKRNLKNQVIEQSDQPLCLLMRLAKHLRPVPEEEFTYSVQQVIDTFGEGLKRLNNRNGAVTKKLKKTLGLTKLTSKTRIQFTYTALVNRIRSSLKDSNWEPDTVEDAEEVALT